MINLIFYLLLGLAAYIIAKVFLKFDSWVDNQFQPPSKELLDSLWFYKYEKYRKGVGKE